MIDEFNTGFAVGYCQGLCERQGSKLSAHDQRHGCNATGECDRVAHDRRYWVPESCGWWIDRERDGDEHAHRFCGHPRRVDGCHIAATMPDECTAEDAL